VDQFAFVFEAPEDIGVGLLDLATRVVGYLRGELAFLVHRADRRDISGCGQQGVVFAESRGDVDDARAILG